MRRVTEKKKDVQKRNSIIMGIIMIGLLIFSYAGYSLMSSEKNSPDAKVDEGFVKQNGFWYYVDGEQTFRFTYSPSEVADVKVFSNKTLEEYSGQPIYFIGEGDYDAMADFVTDLNGVILRYQFACMENCTEDLPLKDCSSNLIVFYESNKTQVEQHDNCIYLAGNWTQAMDAYLYQLLQIN